MIPLIQLPALVEKYAPYFEDLFTPGEYGQFQRYVSGLLLSDNKTVSGMNRLFVQPVQHQSSLNRLLSAGGYDIEKVNERRLSFLEACPQTSFKKGRPSQGGVLVIDDTLLKHVGRHFEQIANLFDHVERRYVWAHNLVTLHYSDDEVDYPVYFQLWKPADVELLEQTLLKNGVRIGPKQRLMKEEAPDKWRTYLLRRCNENQGEASIRQAYRSKLTIAQELLQSLVKNHPDAHMPLTFDSWYSAAWFCRWLDRDLKRAYVATLNADERIFVDSQHICQLDAFAQQLKEQQQAKAAKPLFKPITIPYKGKEETYYTYCNVHRLPTFGRHRLLINYRQEDLSDKPTFYICNRLEWEASVITRIRRHRWPVEVYHEEGKAEGLEQYQVRDFEGIYKHIAFIALTYSMLQRARFDSDLVAKLQQALEHNIQGSLAYWRRVLRAHALMAILYWVSQAVLQGEDCTALWRTMTKAIAYPF